MNPAQILAMVRYEVLMAFRRRSLIILLVLFILGLFVFSLIARDTSTSSAIRVREVDGQVVYMQGDSQIPEVGIPEWLRGVDLAEWQGSSQIIVAMMAAVVLVSIAIVMFMNESIPLDRQYRIRELLDALPLSRASYIGGKLLGAWAGALLISLVAAVASLAIFFAIFERFNLMYWAMEWVLFILPIILINTTFAVLLTSWSGSRRAAILVSLLVIPLAMIVYSFALPSLGAAGVFIHPSYAMFILLQPDASAVDAVSQRIRDVLPLLITLPVLSWVAAYGWQRLREAR